MKSSWETGFAEIAGCLGWIVKAVVCLALFYGLMVGIFSVLLTAVVRVEALGLSEGVSLVAVLFVLCCVGWGACQLALAGIRRGRRDR